MANTIEIGWQRQLTTETRPWEIEMAAELDEGDIISAVSATLVDLLTGLSFPSGLSGAASFSGTTVSQATSGLVAGHNYRLVLTAAVGGSKQTATVLLISCSY